MTTQGIEGLYVATHNWGKAVKFFQVLGYSFLKSKIGWVDDAS